jgi:hypothetical protein
MSPAKARRRRASIEGPRMFSDVRASPSVNHSRIGAGSASSCSMMLQTTFEALVLFGSYGRKGAPALSRIPWRSEAASGLDPSSVDGQHSARRTRGAGRTSGSQRCGHLDAARHARHVRVDLEVDTPGASISRSTEFGETCARLASSRTGSPPERGRGAGESAYRSTHRRDAAAGSPNDGQASLCPSSPEFVRRRRPRGPTGR